MKRFNRCIKALTLVAVGLMACQSLVAADDDEWRSLHREVEQGHVVALSEVLDWLERHYIGQVLEVELARDADLPRYEIEMIGPQGQVVAFEFDATTGEMLGIEGVNIDGMTRP
ncbi:MULTISPECIES: PepSY domain-containing protein [Chromohalobacter]|nr:MULTISPECIES: PepSY domain-containing protein [Chromohalobacter]MCI0509123.1 peptidase [Chromohalobacter sp.]MCI0592790.1 peptidase [Chromohalobacter sp.]